MSGRAATKAVIPGRCAMSVGDPQSALATGWHWTPLSVLAQLGTGHTPSRGHPEYWDGDVPWIGIRDASKHHGGIISDTQQHITTLGLENSSARLLPKDTVCLSRTASVGYVVSMGREMATSQDFVTWSCGPALDPDFLMKALLAEGSSIRRFGEGSTHTTIYFPEVKAFHIALPPVPEQRRIVAKIDSLSAKSRRARDHLDHIPRLVKKYKQAILAAAFRGELTREWRDKNEGERAPDLEALTAQQISLFSKADHLRDGDKAEAHIAAPPFPIPKFWTWLRAERLCGPITKGTTPATSQMIAGEGEIPFIKVYNLTFRGDLGNL